MNALMLTFAFAIPLRPRPDIGGGLVPLLRLPRVSPQEPSCTSLLPYSFNRGVRSELPIGEDNGSFGEQ